MHGAGPCPDLRGARVLIAEDNPLIALDVADGVMDAGGEAVGPVATVNEALALACTERLDAAILDVDLADGVVAPVMALLAERRLPMIVHTGAGRPACLRGRFEHVPIFPKPTPREVLAAEIARRLPPVGQGDPES